MSTMYYTVPEKKPIGQVHSLGKGKGYHFTWCMFPLAFCDFATHALFTPSIVTEYGEELSMNVFVAIVETATRQSFDERIE